MADALSWEAELASLSRPNGVLLELMEEGLKNDPVALGLISDVQKGETKSYSFGEGFLLLKRRRDFMSLMGTA